MRLPDEAEPHVLDWLGRVPQGRQVRGDRLEARSGPVTSRIHPGRQRHDLRSALHRLISHHQVPASVTLTQVDFGWEIASTHGLPAHFQVKNYWLHTRAR
jgi:hypothetical protein